MSKITQQDLIFSYFTSNPNRDIPHAEVVDWATRKWLEMTGKVFRDPDRAIRKLHGQGQLIKASKGIYRYDPDAILLKGPLDFTEEQKRIILERDEYKCSICGKGQSEGVELHVDHIKPRSLGGEPVLENGQILCSTHNFRKKTYSQTESGKKMFINLLRIAEFEGDASMIDFCKEVLDLYKKHGINDHIRW